MPLVVPGLMSSSSDNNNNEQETWLNKLVGKKLTDSSASDTTSFAKRDLPEEHRVIEHGDMVTQDFKPDRLNVHLAEDGTVRHVDFQ